MNATGYFLRLPSCELEIVAATTTTSAMSPTSLNGSWFKTHYDCTIPEIFFSGSGLELIELPSIRLISPEKILAIGLYLLAHGNSHLKIGQTFNVGNSAVIEAAQDVVGSLYELWDDYIKFPENLPRP